MNESQTRHNLIDPALEKAGWGVVAGSRIHPEYPISQGRLIGQGRRKNPLRADYVLTYKNRHLAVIEAKARDKYHTEGLTQAKNYAQKLDIRFAYATNGKQIYQVDMQQNAQDDIECFPSPDELWQMSFPPQENSTPESQNIAYWQDKFFQVPFESKRGQWQLRYYQELAIQKVLEAISRKQKRILLTLATGTGKTAIAFQIVWKLFQARWNLTVNTTDYYERIPRVLFLTDRNILANQSLNAFNNFNSFEEEALIRIYSNEIRKKKQVPTHGSIFFTIFQTFMSSAVEENENSDLENTKEEKYNFGEYPQDFFDFIIIDECHRGGANDESTWRQILEYFECAVQLGLTATPKRKDNVDTYKYFGKPVYTYALKDGINDGFLTPFRVTKIHSTIDEYEHTSDNKVLQGEIEQGEKFEEKDFNTNLQMKKREKFRVEHFLNLINPNHKTLVFCKNQDHALLIRDLINQYSQNKNSNYCQRVTANDGKLGETHLNNFKDNEKTIPTILTTSHKLSTGVDAPEVRNIVLLRPVKSIIEFKQIIGRGTRLLDGKDYFTIYDFVKAYKNFKDPEWDGEPLEIIESNTDDTVYSNEINKCLKCNKTPCICTCSQCNHSPCTCEKTKIMIKIELSNENYRKIDSMIETIFFDSAGRIISAEEFIKQLFDELPNFFKSEGDLRKIWKHPKTREDFLQKLYDDGYTQENLKNLQKLVNGEHSDLFDVLCYVAYEKNMISREERTKQAKLKLAKYNKETQNFLNFVFKQYIDEGEKVLNLKELYSLLKLKYKTTPDAKSQLGETGTIQYNFIKIQKYLYAY